MTSDASRTAHPPHASGTADVQWRGDRVPVSPQFDDSYYSDTDGRAETREVFLQGNALPDSWREKPSFTIAELGFGTGLNFLETVKTWRETQSAPAQLHYFSFERYPLPLDDLRNALSRWPDLLPLADEFLPHWPTAGTEFSSRTSNIALTVFIGDARPRIQEAVFQADAWYLDGFSPAKNPELWDVDLLTYVFEHTVRGGTYSTYTAAGWVRRNLATAGFSVERVPGFGRKRERLQGNRPGDQ